MLHLRSAKCLSYGKVIGFYFFADFGGDELFLLADIDLSRCCFGFGDFEAAARLRLLAAGTAAFLGLDTACDFAGDFAAGEGLAAVERTLPRVTRLSAEVGVFDTERLELRGILMISTIQSKVYLQHEH